MIATTWLTTSSAVIETANHPSQVIQRLERLDLHARLVVVPALGQLLTYPAHVIHLSRRETGAARYATTRLRNDNDDLLEGQRALGSRCKNKSVRHTCVILPCLGKAGLKAAIWSRAVDCSLAWRRSRVSLRVALDE